jgi:hypothetical protein
MRRPAIERLVTSLSGADTWVIVEDTGMLATARASSARRNKPSLIYEHRSGREVLR